MSGYLTALGFAVIPAIANFFGGIVAEITTVSQRIILSLALHLAAGIVRTVLGLELMAEALAPISVSGGDRRTTAAAG